VGFSGALDPGPAANLSDYTLVALGKPNKSGARSITPVTLASATYNPAMDTVTLRPRGTLATQTVQLTIFAAGTLDASGRPIDGNRDGQPGGNFVTTLGTKGGISLARVTPAGQQVSAAAFDALQVSGGLPKARGIGHAH